MQQHPRTALAEPWRPKVQVPSDRYSYNYDNFEKWVNYHWQISNVYKYRLGEVLEVGVGSKVVTSYLRGSRTALTTLDIDPALGPDVAGSVTDLPFAAGSFDGILCTEVLEHMPFDATRRAIREMHRVARTYAFVTVPHFALSFALLVRLPVLHLREFRFRLPYPKPLKPNKQHFWECGRPGYPLARLRGEFRDAGFRIASEERPPGNYSAAFFVLEKR